MTQLPHLDPEELLHLALEASRQNDSASAINYLKQAQFAAPTDGRICYLLSAEHAQLGMYDRAVEEMTKAVELDPTLHTASLQLGLLHLTRGNIEMALAAWEPLEQLPKSNPLYLFKHGLVHLAHDELVAAKEQFMKGIALNTGNIPLNHDITRIIDEIDKKLGENPPPDTPPPTADAGSHVLLSAYKTTKN